MQGIHRKERENRKSKQKKRKTHLTHTAFSWKGLLWCYMHSSVAMITLLTTSISRSGKLSPRPDASASHDTLRCRSSRGLLKSLNASQ